MKIQIYSFFSGAGFLDLGFEHAGFKINFVNEYNSDFMDIYKYSRNILNHEIPKRGYFNCSLDEFLRKEQKDCMKIWVEEDKKEGLVGFIGGPPCPDFSIAGKNRGFDGENGKLTHSYKRLINQQLPDFFVFENVKGLWKTKKHREEYEKIKKSFKRNGYVLNEKLINSLEYGVPQHRERIFLIGIHKDIFINQEVKAEFQKNFNWGEKRQYNLKTIKNFKWPTQNPFTEESVTPCPENIIQELTVEYWFNKNNVTDHPNSLDYFKPRQALNKFYLVDEGNVSKKSFKRLHRWRYSPTVAYGNNEVHLHPYIARRISVSEALSLQSLPKEFIIKPDISLTSKFKVIGNGVPYLVAKEIAANVKGFLECMLENK